MTEVFSTSDERSALVGFLEQQRQALVRKVSGLDDRAARSVPTASALSLLGLLKHCTVWEERWFQVIVAGRTLPDGWPDRRTPGADFEIGEDDTVEEWLRRYARASAESRRITAATALDQRCARTDLVDENLRWVLLHLIEETARHAGHADILRESIDGSRGM